MPPDHEQKKPSPEPIEEELVENLIEERANEAWLEFKMTGEPIVLATYLKIGGEIDENVRQEIISLLITHSKKKNTPSNPYRDRETFWEIELMLKTDGYAQAMFKRGYFEGQPASAPKKLSCRQACLRYAERTGQELRRVEKQYERGKMLEMQNTEKSTKK